MKIIIGLGNPGDKYTKTRHNAGFMAVDYLAQHLELTWHHDKSFNALIAKSSDFLLVKPQTFMNESGLAVGKVARYYKLRLDPQEGFGDRLVVIHDDLDLPLGSWRRSFDSSSGGQKGVGSIIEALGSKKFTRLRLGIKTEKLGKIRLGLFKSTPADFVLARFPAGELKAIETVIKEISKDIL